MLLSVLVLVLVLLLVLSLVVDSPVDGPVVVGVGVGVGAGVAVLDPCFKVAPHLKSSPRAQDRRHPCVNCSVP